MRGAVPGGELLQRDQGALAVVESALHLAEPAVEPLPGLVDCLGGFQNAMNLGRGLPQGAEVALPVFMQPLSAGIHQILEDLLGILKFAFFRHDVRPARFVVSSMKTAWPR